MPPKLPPAPWTGADVLLFFALWFATLIICSRVIGVVEDTNSPTQPQAAVTENAENGHPIAQLIRQSQNAPVILLVAFLAAVVIAPIIEEFLFRLLLQGWLETTLAKLQVPSASSIAIVAVSFCFAVIHGGNNSSLNISLLVYLFGTFIVTNILVLAFGIFYLQRKRNVQIALYFFGTRPFFSPHFFMIAGLCLSVLVLIYGITSILSSLTPNANVSPIPIFFFSLLLGTLYSKTQNLSYSILLHACLNGTSFTLVWFGT